eukprot:363309-Chlamydomonas_euryale.AAC.17
MRRSISHPYILRIVSNKTFPLLSSPPSPPALAHTHLCPRLLAHPGRGCVSAAAAQQRAAAVLCVQHGGFGAPPAARRRERAAAAV